MVTKRQQDILRTLIFEHIQSENTIPSSHLAVRFDLSPAMMRIELAELERQGYLAQPHPSAGRIPTEEGYRFFVEHTLHETNIQEEEQDVLTAVFKNNQSVLPLKSLARALSEITNELIFLNMGGKDSYVTGLAYFLSKSEFGVPESRGAMLRIVKFLESGIHNVFRDVVTIQIIIGRDNPVSSACSVVVIPYKIHHLRGVIGILGPMRMDYSYNYSVMKYIDQLIANFR